MVLYITFTKWDLPVLHCLKCALFQHHAHHTLHYLLVWHELYWRLPFALNLGNLCLLQFHHLVICSINLGTAEVLFVYISSKSFSLAYFTPSFSSFSVLLCESWLLRERKPVNHDMIQTLFSFYLQRPRPFFFQFALIQWWKTWWQLFSISEWKKQMQHIMSKLFLKKKSLFGTIY